MPSTLDKTRTEKMRRCMEQVVAKGHAEDSACAICTTSLQNLGEMVFEGLQDVGEVRILASAEPRELHLLGATGRVRYEMLNDRKHLVVPVVALMEGVIHPVNAETPEFVSQAVLQKAAASWVGKPVTVTHPSKGGRQCSASDADVRKAVGIGVIMRSEWKNNRLLQEAWIDEEKAKSVHPAMYETLASGGREEVSVGAFVITSANGGNYKGKAYKATWLETQGDHLAFLPGGRGACSCEMGCGTHRAAGDRSGQPGPSHFIAACGRPEESLELLPESLPLLAYSTLEGQSLDDRMSAINAAVEKQYSTGLPTVTPSSYAYPVQIFDDSIILKKDGKFYAVPYDTAKDGTITFGAQTEVKQQWVNAGANPKGMTKECALCKGLGNLGGNPCDECDGEGYLKAAAGARHSSSDIKMIQTVHDHAVALGAGCDRKNLEAAQAIPPAPQLRVAVRHEGTKWVLYSTDGKRRLAEHNTEVEANKQAEAIRAALAKPCG